jgi:hypothetical protein
MIAFPKSLLIPTLTITTLGVLILGWVMMGEKWEENVSRTEWRFTTQGDPDTDISNLWYIDSTTCTFVENTDQCDLNYFYYEEKKWFDKKWNLITVGMGWYCRTVQVIWLNDCTWLDPHKFRYNSFEEIDPETGLGKTFINGKVVKINNFREELTTRKAYRTDNICNDNFQYIYLVNDKLITYNKRKVKKIYDTCFEVKIPWWISPRHAVHDIYLKDIENFPFWWRYDDTWICSW